MKIGVGSDDIVATIYGCRPQDVPDLMKLQAGDYNNGNSGCLVGSTFAKDHNLKVGSRISIGTDGSKGTLRVTGIIEERGMSFDISTDNAIVVTQEWFENAYNRNEDYDEVVVKVKEAAIRRPLRPTIEKQLNKHKDNKIVSVTDSKATLASIYSTFGTVTTFVTAIGGISMVVAGVSIFNIMMMSVNERIKEIGIMRSIGTQKKEVMSMFIYEAAIIGVIGSVIGGIFSILAGICHQRPDAGHDKIPAHDSQCPLGSGRGRLRDRDLSRMRHLPGMAGGKHEPDRCAQARVRSFEGNVFFLS